MGDVAVNIFDISKIDVQPIPLRNRPGYRSTFGYELHQHYGESAFREMKKLAKQALVSDALLAKLFAGEDTHDQATIERLNRIATALSCELVLRNTEGEKYYGASTTFEELLRMGIWPTLERIPNPT
jgi:hypothetical protein